MAPGGSSRSTTKRKNSDATGGDVRRSTKKCKSDASSTKPKAATMLSSTTSKDATAQKRSTKAKQPKASSVLDIRLVITREWGGKKHYVPTRERLREERDGYSDELSDMDSVDLGEVDPKGDMELYQTVPLFGSSDTTT